jgi:geranylgeranyl pyrophosphate synthase
MPPDTPAILPWFAEERAFVRTAARAFVERHAASTEQRSLLDAALEEMRAAAPGPSPAPHLALLVYAAETGDPAPARPLGLATALAELGMDLIDHVTDSELGRRWHEPRPERRLIAGISLLASAPLALEELDLPQPRRDHLRHHFLSGLFPVAAGQLRDLELRHEPAPAPEAVQAAVQGKTGDRRAHYAHLGALAAGAPGHRCQSWAGFGRHLGVATQLVSDAADATAGDDSRDLASGTPTLPIALWLASLTDGERQEAMAELRRARTERAARLSVRDALRTCGAIRFCLVLAAREVGAARGVLDTLAPPAPWSDRMRSWLASILV